MLHMSQAAMPPLARQVSADQEDDLKLTQKSLTPEEEADRGDGVAAADLDQNVIQNYQPVKPYKVLTFKQKIIVSIFRMNSTLLR